MPKHLLLWAILLLPFSAAAQESCICYKCLLGQHRMIRISSTSMSPSFTPDQCWFSRYINQDYTQLAYGDVITYQHPVTGEQFLNRLMAMGGDTLQMIDGNVWL